MSELPAGVDYQFMGLRLVRQNSFLSQKGELYVDALRVEFEPSTGADVEQVLVPIEANCKTIDNGYLNILFNGVKYNVDGKVIQ